MTRQSPLAALLLMAACTGGLNVGGLVDPGASERRGAVEVAVKTTFPGILAEIDAGGGPAIEAAFDAAGVPAGDRAARLTQLDGDLGLYAANPGALIAALSLYGS